MTAVLRWLDRKTYLMILLFVFWAVFWGLNGLDKYFNGQSAANLAPWATKAVLVDRDGKPVLRMQPVEPRGFFGVTRDNKTIGYFDRLGLGKLPALVFLHFVGVSEIVLGVMFTSLIVWSLLPFRWRDRDNSLWGAFRDRTMHRLAFKGGIMVFILFAIGDIMVGDRAELWEHGTYMILCLVTYDMWYRTDKFISDLERKEAQRETYLNRPVTDESD